MSEPEVVGCACGQDHQTMPTFAVIDGGPDVEGVCRVHKRHIPCRRCAREACDDDHVWVEDGTGGIDGYEIGLASGTENK